MKNNENVERLDGAPNPIQTILSNSQSNIPESLIATLVKPSKKLFKRFYQKDQLAMFRQSYIIKDFKQIGESVLRDLGPELKFVKI